MQLLHYGQEVNSRHFRQYDYGRVENLMRYKRLSPPDYDLDNIRVPVAIYYSQGNKNICKCRFNNTINNNIYL